MADGSERWRVFPSRDALVAALADSLADDIRAAVAARGTMRFGASGGSTPKPVYERLAAMNLDWKALTVVVVDERAVPPTHEASNQRMIASSLLDGHDEATLVGLWSDAPTLAAMAEFAAARVRALPAPLDTVLLGMGEDGHFASCFPTAETFDALIAADGEAVLLPVSPMPPEVTPALERLSLTWSYLRRARRIVLAITGAKKRELLLRAMHGATPRRLPIAAVFAAGMPDVEVYWSE
jgi:6-phosphogluconolactonase